MKKHLYITHGRCLDGFTAAFLLDSAAKVAGIEAEHVFWEHNQNDEVVDALARHAEFDRIYFVDICPTMAMIDELARAGLQEKVHVLDHHISITKVEQGEERSRLEALQHNGFTNVTYNPKHSGAMLTLHNICGPDPIEDHFVELVERGDLWNFDEAGETEALRIIMETTPKTFLQWEQLHLTVNHEEKRERLLTRGRDMLKYRADLIAKMVRHATMGTLRGHRVPFINMNDNFWVSETGNALVRSGDHPFAVIFSIDGLDARLSLRSIEGRQPVDEIAMSFGGGGHKLAAGCKVSLETFMRFFKVSVEDHERVMLLKKQRKERSDDQ